MLSFKYTLINKTGGLFYHLKALKYKNKYWKGFKKNLNNWALSWPQKNRALLIFGPSAAYTLEDRFLNRYEHVHCVDVDPTAPLFFNLIHKNKKYKLTWDIDNYFDDLDLLKEKINSDSYDILFSNILGQLPLVVKNWEQINSKFMKNLNQILKGKNWATYHDLYSSNTKPKNEKSFNINNISENFESQKSSVQLTDHMTKNLFANTQKKDYFVWQIKPKYFHIIEATYDL